MSFRSLAEFEDPKNAPTTAEKALIAAARAGKPCRLWTGEKPHRPAAPSDATRIRASLLRLLILGGSPACGLHESGVWLEGAWIDGPLDLAFCTARGATVLRYCYFTDQPNLTQTTLPLLSLNHSALPGLFAQGSQIAGDLSLRSVTATGSVNVDGAKIGGQLDCIDATLKGGQGEGGVAQKALNAQGVEVGESLFLRSITATGTVDVNGARIGGQLSCTDATLNGGRDKGGAALVALNAQGLEVGQDFFLTSTTAMGSVDVNGARIGGQFDCEGATLNGGQDKGGVAHDALIAQRLTVTQGFFFRNVAKVQGRIDLTAAHVGDLIDDADSWPDVPNSLTLDGFTYDRIGRGRSTTFSDRRNWLHTGSHGSGDFFPQPYTQLARTLRQMGHAGEARRVLMERERLLAAHRLAADRAEYQRALNGGPMERGDAGWIWLRMRGAQAWSALTRRVAGYGYAPQYALYWSLACIILSCVAYMAFWRLGAMVPSDAVILTSAEWLAAYQANPTAPALVWAAGSGPATSHYETFYSALYALDVFLPIVHLGQQSTWGQTTVTWAGWGARLYTWLLQAAGYVVTTLGLAAATGIIQRNQPD